MQIINMFFYRFERKGKEVLLAACDQELLGRTFVHKELKMKVEPGFYGSKKGSVKKIQELSRHATIINVVGKRIVNLLSEEGLIDEKKILKIAGVPYAQVVIF